MQRFLVEFEHFEDSRPLTSIDIYGEIESAPIGGLINLDTLKVTEIKTLEVDHFKA
jgi:hypothetical protein